MSKALAVFLFVLMLPGCSTFFPSTKKPVNTAEVDINHWQLKGRIGVQNGDEAWSASFVWEQHDDDYNLQIIAPLGQGTTQITGSGQFVIAKYPDGQIIQYDDPQRVFKEAVGVMIPVSSLRYWVMGLADDNNAAKIRRNDDQRIEEIQQEGWEVSYLRYSSEWALPSKIFAENEMVEVRLIIKEWEFNPTHG